MADPEYGVEHSGNTPGADTLIILNGPIIKELGFNYTQGVMRDGFQPNTSVGRFWRLYLRNVAGFLPHKTDKATFGNTWRVVVAGERGRAREDRLAADCVDMGFKPGDNAVTIARYTGGNLLAGVGGSTPEEMLPYLADAVLREISVAAHVHDGHGNGMLRPLLLITPILARQIAKAGWSKPTCKRYLFEHARMPAWQFERLELRDWENPGPGTSRTTCAGAMPEIFHGVRRPGPPRAAGLRPGRFHDRRDRRSAADQRVRVRAQWPPRFPGGPPGRARRKTGKRC